MLVPPEWRQVPRRNFLFCFKFMLSYLKSTNFLFRIILLELLSDAIKPILELRVIWIIFLSVFHFHGILQNLIFPFWDTLNHIDRHLVFLFLINTKISFAGSNGLKNTYQTKFKLIKVQQWRLKLATFTEDCKYYSKRDKQFCTRDSKQVSSTV